MVFLFLIITHPSKAVGKFATTDLANMVKKSVILQLSLKAQVVIFLKATFIE